jgi:hypothetical protein
LKIKTTLLTFVIILLMSCAGNLEYLSVTDDELEPSEVSFIRGGQLEIDGRYVSTRFEWLDGEKISPWLQFLRHEGFWRIKVSPGQHSIGAYLVVDNSATRVLFDLKTKPGYHYTFNPSIKGDSLEVKWVEEMISNELIGIQ